MTGRNEAWAGLEMMAKMVNPHATRKMRERITVRFAGDDPAALTLEIDHGVGRVVDGAPAKPSVTIDTDYATWAQVTGGTMEFADAFKAGKMKAGGNLLLLMRMGNFFTGDEETVVLPEGVYPRTENIDEYHAGRWTKPRRVLGLQASPRGEKGATDLIYRAFADGLAGTGARVDTVYLRDLTFAPCRGCFGCWSSPEPRCVITDDASKLTASFADYDLIVLATPLYVDGMTGQLKMLIDRMIPNGHPAIYMRDGRCRHPARRPRVANLALVSVCGFYEMENFDPLVQHVQAIANNMHAAFVARILRPAAGLLQAPMFGARAEKVIDAIRQAGREVAETGGVKENTMKAVTHQFITRGQYLVGARDWWERAPVG